MLCVCRIFFFFSNFLIHSPEMDENSFAVYRFQFFIAISHFDTPTGAVRFSIFPSSPSKKVHFLNERTATRSRLIQNENEKKSRRNKIVSVFSFCATWFAFDVSVGLWAFIVREMNVRWIENTTFGAAEYKWVEPFLAFSHLSHLTMVHTVCRERLNFFFWLWNVTTI